VQQSGVPQTSQATPSVTQHPAASEFSAIPRVSTGYSSTQAYQPPSGSQGGFAGRIIHHIRQRSSSKDGGLPSPSSLPRSTTPQNEEPQDEQKSGRRRSVDFIGLPPIRRGSTFGLGFGRRDPQRRFPLDDDDDDEMEQPSVVSSISNDNRSPADDNRVVEQNPARTANTAVETPSDPPMTQTPAATTSTTQVNAPIYMPTTYTSVVTTTTHFTSPSRPPTLQPSVVSMAPQDSNPNRPPVLAHMEPVVSQVEVNRRSPAAQVEAAFGAAAIAAAVGNRINQPSIEPSRYSFQEDEEKLHAPFRNREDRPRDTVSPDHGRTTVMGPVSPPGSPPPHSTFRNYNPMISNGPQNNGRNMTPRSYQEPPTFDSQHLPSGLIQARHASLEGQRSGPFHPQPQGPSFEGQRVRSPSSLSGRSGSPPILNNGVYVPPPRSLIRQQIQAEQPPSSARRYPELFNSELAKETSVDGLPAHYYQAPVSREDAFLPRQQTNEYQLPGVGPPPDEPQAGKHSRRNSGLFKELGGRLSRTTSRDRGSTRDDDDARSPISLVASRNLSGQADDGSSIASEEVPDRKRRTSILPFFHRGRRESTGGPVQSRENVVVEGQPLKNSPLPSLSDTRRALFGNSRSSSDEGKQKPSLFRASTSSLSGDHPGKKKRFSGLTGIFSRSSMDQERKGTPDSSVQTAQDLRNSQGPNAGQPGTATRAMTQNFQNPQGPPRMVGQRPSTVQQQPFRGPQDLSPNKTGPFINGHQRNFPPPLIAGSPVGPQVQDSGNTPGFRIQSLGPGSPQIEPQSFGVEEQQPGQQNAQEIARPHEPRAGAAEQTPVPRQLQVMNTPAENRGTQPAGLPATRAGQLLFPSQISQPPQQQQRDDVIGRSASPQTSLPNSQGNQPMVTTQPSVQSTPLRPENRQRQSSATRLFSGLRSRFSSQQDKDEAAPQPQAGQPQSGQPVQQQPQQQQPPQQQAQGPALRGDAAQQQERGRAVYQERQYEQIPIPGAYNLVRGEGNYLAPTSYDPRGFNRQWTPQNHLQQASRDQNQGVSQQPPDLRVNPNAPGPSSPNGSDYRDSARSIRPSLEPQHTSQSPRRSGRPLSNEDVVARSPARPQFGQQAPYQLSLPDEDDKIRNKASTDINTTPIQQFSPGSSRSQTDNAVHNGQNLSAQRNLPTLNTITPIAQPELRHPQSPATYPLPEDTVFSPVNEKAYQLPPPPPPKWPQQVALSPSLDRSNTTNTKHSEISQLSGQLGVLATDRPSSAVTAPSPQITPQRTPERSPPGTSRSMKAMQPEEDVYSATPRNASPAPREVHSSKGKAVHLSPDEKILVDESGSPSSRRRQSQEEKILVEEGMVRPGTTPEEEIPSMSATSYPGQEWHPYGNGYEEWD
jgi:hypothetical protein